MGIVAKFAQAIETVLCVALEFFGR